ncbi:MAG TPA: hypothetical protein VM030_10650 [Acidimicrobiales bacterium]|nr:hypothetical protein [Acidimicrobiales bacterium]
MARAKVGSPEWMRSLVREAGALEEGLAARSGALADATDGLNERARKLREALTAGAVSAESADLLVRGMPPVTLDRFKRAAGARALRYADYVSALVELHDAMRRLADTGDHPEVADALDELGLSTVTA